MNEQEVRILFKEVMDKEAERNTKDNSRSHTYSEICSCDRCHIASILVASLKSFEPKKTHPVHATIEDISEHDNISMTLLAEHLGVDLYIAMEIVRWAMSRPRPKEGLESKVDIRDRLNSQCNTCFYIDKGEPCGKWGCIQCKPYNEPKVASIEQIIASNVPIEFIQVVEPFKRAEIYKRLAVAIAEYLKERKEG